jgi:hypothetical protein
VRFSPARVEALERRGAAIHEAGHVVIARHVGADVLRASIFRNPDVTPDEVTWVGQATAGGPHVSRSHMTMIGVAGAISERVWDGEEEFLRWDDAWTDADIMSPTDWQMAGAEPGEPDEAFMCAVEEVLNLLTGPLRAKLYATARRRNYRAAARRR